MPSLDIHESRTGEDEKIGLLTLEGTLDQSTVADFEGCIDKWVLGGTGRYIIHLGKVRHIDSRGWSALLNFSGRLTKDGGKVALAHMQPPFQPYIQMLSLTDFFVIRPDVSSAATALGN